MCEQGLYYYGSRFVPADRALELYMKGCIIKCEGCQNKELQEINYLIDKPVLPDSIVSTLVDYKDVHKRVDIIGGEPTLQSSYYMEILTKLLKENGFKNIVFFTGRYFNEKQVKSCIYPAWKYCDYVKVGPYIQGDESYIEPLLGLKLASRNQKVFKVL